MRVRNPTRPALIGTSRTGEAKAVAQEREAGEARPAAPLDVTTIQGIPQSELTPRVRMALDVLMAEVQELRGALSQAKKRIGYLENLADQDTLAPVLNRRAFVRELARMISFAERYETPGSVLYFDIDGMKAINDRHGHGAGDLVVRHAAETLLDRLRGSDLVGRLGGDEFGVIFWDPAGPRRANSAHPHDPVAVAKRFQKAICAARFPKLGHEAPGTLTISGGLAGFPWDGYTPDQLLDRADKMAMRSKQQGKNAITFGPGAQRFFRQNGGN